MNTILRRLSLTACIGSYFIYNKLKYCQYKVDEKDNTNEGEIQQEDTNATGNNQTNTAEGPNNNEEEEEDESIGPNSEDEDEDDEINEEGPVADAGQSGINEGTQLQSAHRTGGSYNEDDVNSTPVNTDIASDPQESLSNQQIST